MSILSKFLISVSGNRFIQAFLEKNVQYSQYLMGIGSGGDVCSSGEYCVFAHLAERNAPPYIIFDVGSNNGQYLDLVKRHILEDFTIHCFEPCKKSFRGLIKVGSEDDRVVLNNIGLGRNHSQAVMYYDKPGSGAASLTKRRLEHFGTVFNKQETVQISTIDEYCLRKSIDRIDLLKLDIEGHELDALKGSQNMFDQNAIGMVMFEFGGCNIDTRIFFQDFWYFFLEKNFHVFRIAPSGYLVPIASYEEIHEQFRTSNFVALPRASE